MTNERLPNHYTPRDFFLEQRELPRGQIIHAVPNPLALDAAQELARTGSDDSNPLPLYTLPDGSVLVLNCETQIDSWRKNFKSL